MINTIQNFLPWAVLASHVVLALVLLSILAHKGWGRDTVNWLGKHALKLSLLVSLLAVSGSLFYSNFVGFLPCDLCWWQRIFLYPNLILFIVAVRSKAEDVWKYVVPLVSISGIISLYHLYIQMGGNSILPCSATASCDKIYVSAFGYITIPTMSLTIAVAFLLLAWAKKVYDNNRNA